MSIVSSPSGAFVSRGSISKFIESSISAVFTDAMNATLKLDVMSDHQVYCDTQGTVRGVFVVTAAPPPLGSAVRLEIQLPWGEVLHVAGTVEWVRDLARLMLRHRPGIGVQFDADPHQLHLLERAMVLRQPMTIPSDARFVQR